VGVPLELTRVLVRNPGKPRSIDLDPSLITTDPAAALGADCDIVVEVMGGEQPAYDYMRRSLEQGRYVVTANKEVMAKHGPALLSLAADNGTASSTKRRRRNL
jgi:homoserine dehydrogenase